ncbi:DUF4333 domain-containing protein [Nocardia uniformis]|nr:DUF4333 domain-containing protein [Nocardia uniformis]
MRTDPGLARRGSGALRPGPHRTGAEPFRYRTTPLGLTRAVATGKVGTTMRCTLTAGGDTLGLTVTVTSVDGDNVKYDVEVDET